MAEGEGASNDENCGSFASRPLLMEQSRPNEPETSSLYLKSSG